MMAGNNAFSFVHHDFGMNMTAPEGVEGNKSLRGDADYVYTLISRYLRKPETCATGGRSGMMLVARHVVLGLDLQKLSSHLSQ